MFYNLKKDLLGRPFSKGDILVLGKDIKKNKQVKLNDCSF
jgi:hypothetical protein